MIVAQLARARYRSTLILIVIVASGLTASARCVMQVTVELAETRAYYEQTKDAFWQGRVTSLDDPQVELYERRMNAAEATGFFPFSNAQGAGLSLAGFAALALMVTARHNRGRQIVWAFLAALLFTAILLTRGRAAILATLLGVALWMALTRWQSFLRNHWRKSLVFGWLVALLALTSVVIVGRVRGGLPGSSLNFRWQYWQATSQMIGDHLWTGVGAMNFDRAYLSYKPIEYPEEINDPHNFLFSITAQWGMLGLAGLVACMVGASFIAAQNWEQSRQTATFAIQPKTLMRMALWSLVLVPAFILLRFWLLRALWVWSAEGRAFVLFDLGMYGLLWCLASLGLGWMARGPLLDKSQPKNHAESDAKSVPIDIGCLAIFCGLIAFLLQNMIDFSLFFPGTLTIFAAMCGILLARRAKESTDAVRSFQCFSPLVLALVALAAFACVIFIPVTRSCRFLAEARSSNGEATATLFQAAADADPYDPIPYAELAVWEAAGMDLSAINRAMEALNKALLRDPDQLRLQRYRAEFLELRYRLAGSHTDLWAAIGAARRCIAIYPTSPDNHLKLAELLDRSSANPEARDLKWEALDHYRKALQLNEARPGTDEVRRWSTEFTDQIRERIKALEMPPATQAVPVNSLDQNR